MSDKANKAQNKVYNRYDPKPTTCHVERVRSRPENDDSYIVVCVEVTLCTVADPQDESLVRAENEDKVTPYLVLIILAVSLTVAFLS